MLVLSLSVTYKYIFIFINLEHTISPAQFFTVLKSYQKNLRIAYMSNSFILFLPFPLLHHTPPLSLLLLKILTHYLLISQTYDTYKHVQLLSKFAVIYVYMFNLIVVLLFAGSNFHSLFQ